MIRNALGRLLAFSLRLIAGELLTVWGLLVALASGAPVKCRSGRSIHTETARQAKQLWHLNETGEGAFRGTV